VIADNRPNVATRYAASDCCLTARWHVLDPMTAFVRCRQRNVGQQ